MPSPESWLNTMKSSIKEARHQAGLTQKEMSDLLEIPQRTIENWEMGSRKCPHWAERLIIEKLQSMQKESPKA